MTDFLQLHFLTAYGPSNLNRDDTGRPKSVTFGGVPRLRVSSQSLKRAWRESETFQSKLAGYLGTRTQRFGADLLRYLENGGMQEEAALKAAQTIARVFGKIRKGKKGDDKSTLTFIEQLAFISPEERKKAFSLADKIIAEKPALKNSLQQPVEIEAKDEKEERKLSNKFAKDLLCKIDNAADIAMFGRMLADNPQFNREAAVQVAHAFTTHRSVSEDDYYTAIDDLKSRDKVEDAGAGFIGVQEFGSGVFYLYVCIDRGLLSSNLDKSKTIVPASLAALVETASTIGPKGKQASFASRARAIYVLGEKGTSQPRSLAAAFLKPISDNSDYGNGSIDALQKFREKMDQVYGPCSKKHYTMNVLSGEGKITELIEFAQEE